MSAFAVRPGHCGLETILQRKREKMKPISRRQALRLAGGTIALVPLSMLVTRHAAAADLPKVDLADPMAKTLGYVHASNNPEQLCNNCELYTGVAGEEWGPCPIFPGKLVNANGWCKSWITKTG